MDRVRDYIHFVVWFVGLSYVALWPMAVPDMVFVWFAPDAVPAPAACGGLSLASLQQLCRVHETAVLSPGLHLVGKIAASWVTLRLLLLLLSRLMPALRLRPASSLKPLFAAARLGAALRWPLRRLTAPEHTGAARYIPKRREFGLRGSSR